MLRCCYFLWSTRLPIKCRAFVLHSFTLRLKKRNEVAASNVIYYCYCSPFFGVCVSVCACANWQRKKVEDGGAGGGLRWGILFCSLEDTQASNRRIFGIWFFRGLTIIHIFFFWAAAVTFGCHRQGVTGGLKSVSWKQILSTKTHTWSAFFLGLISLLASVGLVLYSYYSLLLLLLYVSFCFLFTISVLTLFFLFLLHLLPSLFKVQVKFGNVYRSSLKKAKCLLKLVTVPFRVFEALSYLAYSFFEPKETEKKFSRTLRVA